MQTDTITYNKAKPNCPRFSNATISNEKVEKVVKAPRNPVTTNNLVASVTSNSLPLSSTKAPIRNEPNTLQTNTPSGKTPINIE